MTTPQDIIDHLNRCNPWDAHSGPALDADGHDMTADSYCPELAHYLASSPAEPVVTLPTQVLPPWPTDGAFAKWKAAQ